MVVSLVSFQVMAIIDLEQFSLSLVFDIYEILLRLSS